MTDEVYNALVELIAIGRVTKDEFDKLYDAIIAGDMEQFNTIKKSIENPNYVVVGDTRYYDINRPLKLVNGRLV